MSNPFFPFSCATLYGCVCTIRSSESVLKARDYVDMKFACRRLKSLVGEADLCLLWEHISSTPQCTPQKIDHELDQWLAKWKAFDEETGTDPECFGLGSP